MASLLALAAMAKRAQLPEEIAAASLAPVAKLSLTVMFAQMPVDTFLAGVFLMQSITYWSYQANDKLWTRCIVIFTTIFAIGFTIYLWWFTGYLFVENFGKYGPFTQTEILAPVPFLDSLNSAVIQSFFCHRAYLLIRRQIWLPIVVGLLIATSVGSTLSVLIIFSGLSAVAEAEKVFIPELLWLTSIMVADFIITVTIIYGLGRSKTGWVNTDRAITKLIRMTFESQMPPTLISLAFMIEFSMLCSFLTCAVITPSSLLGAFFQGIQSKFYAVGLMYALNQRIKFQQTDDLNTVTGGGQVFAMSNRGPTQIQVDVETYVQDSNYPNNAYPSGDKKDLDSSSDLNDKALGYSSQARLTEPHSHIVLN